MSVAVTAYVDALRQLLTDVEQDETGALDEAGERIAASIATGGVLHVFGSGHSMLAAMEPVMRAGGLAAVNLLHDPALSPAEPQRVSHVERLHGYAAAVLNLAPFRADDVLLVISNSGINPVPIEVALGARERGLTVVAVTSIPHSQRAQSRHQSGKRLLDVADVVLDTHAPFGDTTVQVDGLGTGAASTILACAVVNAVTVRAAEALAASGAEVPLLVSQNVDGGDDHNERLLDRYRR